MIIIVVGMHRSGTSAMAGVLANNGVYMGEGKYHPKPSAENPKGFFENKEFRVINDQILRQNKYEVKSFDPAIPHPVYDMVVWEDTKQQMKDLVGKYSKKYTWWGFKDPRTMLTLWFWIDAIRLALPLHGFKVVLMLRNNLDIALSMQKRGNKGSLHKFAQLANRYNQLVREQYSDFIEVQFGDLIYRTDSTLARLTTELNVELQNKGFIEERLANRV